MPCQSNKNARPCFSVKTLSTTMRLFCLLGIMLFQNGAKAADECSSLFTINLSHIVATSSNFVIGNEHNQMPWGHALKQDLKRFKELTSNHMVVMGRKTFQNMYDALGGKPLPNRLSFVITRDPTQIPVHDSVIPVRSIEEAMQIAESHLGRYSSEVFIVGGGEIFSSTYNMIDRLYLTLIDKEIQGAINYPKVDLNKYTVTSSEKKEEAGFNYQFINLKVKK